MSADHPGHLRYAWRATRIDDLPALRISHGRQRSTRFNYRKRNRIERGVGQHQECQALGTRYEKLAMAYVILGMVATIEKLLQLGRKWPHS
jgi:hypothetical protein